MSKQFVQPVIGEVRGPWRSSPGNPMPWQAARYGAKGWIYFHTKTAQEAMRAAKS